MIMIDVLTGLMLAHRGGTFWHCDMPDGDKRCKRRRRSMSRMKRHIWRDHER